MLSSQSTVAVNIVNIQKEKEQNLSAIFNKVASKGGLRIL